MGTETGRMRPLGVTIIAILAAIEGILLLAGGIYAELRAAEVGSFISNSQLGSQTTALTGAALTLITIVGGITIALGIFWFFLAWGLWTGKGWAWIITVILTIISIILGIVAALTGAIANIISLIINFVIIYYLYRPNVKSYFGRGSKLST